jgi:hypothetical protein
MFSSELPISKGESKKGTAFPRCPFRLEQSYEHDYHRSRFRGNEELGVTIEAAKSGASFFRCVDLMNHHGFEIIHPCVCSGSFPSCCDHDWFSVGRMHREQLHLGRHINVEEAPSLVGTNLSHVSEMTDSEIGERLAGERLIWRLRHSSDQCRNQPMVPASQVKTPLSVAGQYCSDSFGERAQSQFD